MKLTVYLEGGGKSKEEDVRCREGFRRLFEKCGFQRMPKLVACGGRSHVYDRFCTALTCAGASDFIALLVDSEDLLADLEATWLHLAKRDGWTRPVNARDEQALFMTTCMETWIVADLQALKEHYDDRLQVTALPPLNDLETRARQDVQTGLERATRNCTGAYLKGRRSYVILGKLDPARLEPLLPSFARTRRILNEKLGTD